jgi:enediyne polyketide synthase
MGTSGEHADITRVAIAGVALELPGASDPASFHDLIVSGGSALGAVPLDFRESTDSGDISLPELGNISGEAERSLAERTAARALRDALPAGLDTGVAGRGEVRIGALVATSDAPLAGSLRAVAAACDALRRGEFDVVLAGGVSLGIDRALPGQRGRPAAEEVRVYDARPIGSVPGEGCGIVALMPATQARALGLEVYAEIAGWASAEPADQRDPAEVIRDAYRRAAVAPGEIQYLEGHGAATEAGDLAELTLLLEAFTDAAPHGCALGAVSACIGDTRAAAGVAGLIKTALAMTGGTIPPSPGCLQPHHLLEKETTPFRLPGHAVPWPETGARLAAVNAMTRGLTHVVLRREPEPSRRPGRRRRAEPDMPAPGLVPRPRTEWPPPGPQQPAAEPPGQQPEPQQPPSDPPRIPVEPPGEMPCLPAQRPPSDLHPPVAPGDRVLGGTGGVPGGTGGDRVAAEPAPHRLPAEQSPLPQAPARPAVPRPPVVVALHGADRSDLASALDTIAIMASRLSIADLQEFARQLAAELAGAHLGPVRAAILATDPPQLAARAQHAAHLARNASLTPPVAGPGCYLSEAAAGRVVLVLGGLADTPLAHAESFAASRTTLDWLDKTGVSPRAVVGYGLGEITALAWAGSITLADAAYLAAQRGEVLRAAPRDTALARIQASADVADELCAGTPLVVVAREGPRQQLLGGPAHAIREMTERAGNRHVRYEIMGLTCALHAPALGALTPAMRGATALVRFRVPRRRVALASAGRELRPDDDIGALVAAQLAMPARFADALAAAAGEADLLLTPPGDHALAAAVATCGNVPVVQAPDAQVPGTGVAARAALFTAGAIRRVS